TSRQISHVKSSDVQFLITMFWGLTLEPGKKYSQLVDYSFRLSMAALEPLPNVAKDKRHVSIMLDHQKTEYMLCTLEHGKLYQQRLELNFVDGEEVCFYIIGQGMVHLTGYHIDNICGDSILCDDDDNDLSTDEECSDESSDDENIGFDTKNGNLSEDSEDDDWTPAKVGEKRNRSSVGNSVVKKMKPNASVKTEISDMTYMTPRRKSSSSNNVDSDQDDEEDGSDSGSSDGEDDSLKKINTAKLGKLNINDSVQIKKNKKKFQIDSSDEKHIDYLKVPVFGRHKDEKCTDSKQLSNKKKKRQLEVTKNVDSVEKQDKSSSSVKQDQNRTVIKESQSA
ncbi:FK506-bp1 (predicted), partial [Pycnogonum litorale]